MPVTVGYVNGPLLAAGIESLDTLIKPIDGTPQLEFVALDSTERRAASSSGTSSSTPTRGSDPMQASPARFSTSKPIAR